MRIRLNVHPLTPVIVIGYLIASLAYSDAKAGSETVIKGTVFMGGEVFGKLNLESKKWEAVYKGSDHRYCEFPNLVGPNLFILETKGSQIEYFDAIANRYTFIANGIKPLYVPEAESLFYYKYKEGLFQQFLSGRTDNKLITNNIYFDASQIQPDVIYYSGPPIKVSLTEIAYYSKESKIEIYDYAKMTTRALDLVGYEPLVYYSDKNSLVCRNRADKRLYFVNILTSGTEKLSVKKPESVESGIVAVNNYNCLIYSKYRSGPLFWESEYKDVWIYWADSKEEEPYIRGFDISYGIYVDNVR